MKMNLVFLLPLLTILWACSTTESERIAKNKAYLNKYIENRIKNRTKNRSVAGAADEFGKLLKTAAKGSAPQRARSIFEKMVNELPHLKEVGEKQADEVIDFIGKYIDNPMERINKIVDMMKPDLASRLKLLFVINSLDFSKAEVVITFLKKAQNEIVRNAEISRPGRQVYVKMNESMTIFLETIEYLSKELKAKINSSDITAMLISHSDELAKEFKRVVPDSLNTWYEHELTFSGSSFLYAIGRIKKVIRTSEEKISIGSSELWFEFRDVFSNPYLTRFADEVGKDLALNAAKSLTEFEEFLKPGAIIKLWNGNGLDDSAIELVRNAMLKQFKDTYTEVTKAVDVEQAIDNNSLIRSFMGAIELDETDTLVTKLQEVISASS